MREADTWVEIKLPCDDHKWGGVQSTYPHESSMKHLKIKLDFKKKMTPKYLS